MKTLLLIAAVTGLAGGVAAQTQVRVDVAGPSFIVEGGQERFQATAVYDDGTTQNVTADAVWTISPAMAGMFVAPGLLNADSLAGCSLTGRVRAAFSENQTVVSGFVEVVVRKSSLAGSMLQLDGIDDFVQVPDSESLDLGQQATIEFWFRPVPSQPFSRILSKGDGLDGASDRAFDIEAGADMLGAVVFLGQPTPQTYACVYHSGLAPQWTHTAVVLDTTVPALSMYVNGELVAQTSNTCGAVPMQPATIRNSSYPVTIGANPPWSYFEGRIDEVRIWSVARTPEQIQARIFAPLPSDDRQGLVGYWRFDEGSGQVANDLSPYGNHGHLGSDLNGSDAADPTWASSTAPIGTGLVTPVADLTGDGLVGLDDLARLLAHFGDAAEYEEGDIDGDGEVDLSDLATLLAAFGTECP